MVILTCAVRGNVLHKRSKNKRRLKTRQDRDYRFNVECSSFRSLLHKLNRFHTKHGYYNWTIYDPKAYQYRNFTGATELRAQK